MLFQSSVLNKSEVEVLLIPALFTNMSTEPYLLRTLSDIDCQLSSLETSHISKCAWPPPSDISSTNCCPAFESTSAKTTLAPSFANNLDSEEPIPLLAPVTMAVLPSSLILTSKHEFFCSPSSVYFVSCSEFPKMS